MLTRASVFGFIEFISYCFPPPFGLEMIKSLFNLTEIPPEMLVCVFNSARS